MRDSSRKSSGFLSEMKVSTPKKEVFSYFSSSSVPCHSSTHHRGQCNIKGIVLSFLSPYSDTSPLFHFLLLPPSAHMVTAASQDLSVTQVLLVRMPRTYPSQKLKSNTRSRCCSCLSSSTFSTVHLPMGLCFHRFPRTQWISATLLMAERHTKKCEVALSMRILGIPQSHSVKICVSRLFVHTHLDHENCHVTQRPRDKQWSSSLQRSCQ